MKGVILGFDEQSGTGHVRAEDGKRYSFTRADLRIQKAIRGGEEVDFDVEGDAARDLYIVSGAFSVDAAALRDAANRVGKLVGSSSAADLSDKLKQSAIAEFVIGRSAVFYSVLILLACFLTLFPASYLMDSTGLFASRISLSSHSLYGTVSMVADWTDKADNVTGGSDNDKKAATAFRGLVYSLGVLSYLYYAIPLLALWVIFGELRGTPSRKLWRWSGAVTIAMPLILGFIGGVLAVALIAGLPSETAFGAPQDYRDIAKLFIPTPFHPGLTAGGIAIFITGALSLLASFKVIKAPAAYLMPKTQS